MNQGIRTGLLMVFFISVISCGNDEGRQLSRGAMMESQGRQALTWAKSKRDLPTALSYYESAEILYVRLEKQGSIPGQRAHGRVLKKMARLFLQMGEPSKALRLLKRARKRAPKDMEIPLYQASAGLFLFSQTVYPKKKKLLQESESYYQEAMRLSPLDPRPLYGLAVLEYRYRKNPRRALSYLDRALVLNPSYLEAHLLFAEIYYETSHRRHPLFSNGLSLSLASYRLALEILSRQRNARREMEVLRDQAKVLRELGDEKRAMFSENKAKEIRKRLP